jgi:hypothetical protein
MREASVLGQSSERQDAGELSHILGRAPPALVCFAGERDWYRAPMLSGREVFAGPRCETARGADGLYRSVKTPPGEFDLAKLVEALPPPQKPALVVAQANRSAQAVARNLHAVPAVKALVLGDTHHMPNPISFLLEYLLAERYDVVVGEFCRQHLHWFVEAGAAAVRWLPFASLNPRHEPPAGELRPGVSFVGQAGARHPYRTRVLEFLRRQGVPLEAREAPHAEAARIHAAAAMSLNVSLNGDLNLRVGEVLAAGGFLFTDRLSRQAGADLLFEDGRHLVFFDGAEHLLDRVRHFEAHPAEARAIRAAGAALALRELNAARKTAQLLDLVRDGRDESLFSPSREPRCRRPKAPALDPLLARLRAYEYVQEEHRRADRLRLIAAPGVSDLLLADLADLPRLAIAATCRDEAHLASRRRAFEREEVAEAIALTVGFANPPPSEEPTVLALGAEDLGLLDGAPAADHVIVEGGRGRLDVDALGRLGERLARRGFRLDDALLPAYRRQA